MHWPPKLGANTNRLDEMLGVNSNRLDEVYAPTRSTEHKQRVEFIVVHCCLTAVRIASGRYHQAARSPHAAT